MYLFLRLSISQEEICSRFSSVSFYIFGFIWSQSPKICKATQHLIWNMVYKRKTAQYSIAKWCQAIVCNEEIIMVHYSFVHSENNKEWPSACKKWCYSKSQSNLPGQKWVILKFLPPLVPKERHQNGKKLQNNDWNIWDLRTAQTSLMKKSGSSLFSSGRINQMLQFQIYRLLWKWVIWGESLIKT